MIKFQHLLAPLLAGLVLTMTGCATDTDSSQRAIVQSPCASNADCPTNFECEVEVEHGVTTSFCQSHDEGGDCPAGLELEIEHGQAFCKPHGDRGNRGSGGDKSGRADDHISRRGSDDGIAATDDRGADDRGADDRGADDRGVDDRGADSRGVDDRGVDDRGSDDRGADDRGADDRGVDDRGADDRGADDRAADDRGADGHR